MFMEGTGCSPELRICFLSFEDPGQIEELIEGKVLSKEVKSSLRLLMVNVMQ
jgi:hypothetical protein